ncbi:MAG TPA: multicopper oxidase family protein [Bryobacteraceae bacterium]|nr:multicopper oxidase family protein [Bryobacteraceae bacterium]
MNRRSFLSLAASASAGLAYRGRSSVYEPQASAGLVQIDLEAEAGLVPFAGRQAYLYGYNNQVPGPLIQARPGDTLRVRFTNSLPEATNLHFHGLHVSPSGAADNSFVMVPPGEQFQYELSIPANHPAGTFWMHPHMHGSVARQVWRGMAAPVVIRGDLDAIPEVQAAREVILVLQDITLNAGGQPIEPSLMQQMFGREGSLIAASGTVNPSIPIQKDGWIRLRLINASCSRFYRLRLEEHDLNQIASDGGALPTPVGLSELLLVPGQRADLLIQGSRPLGSYRLLNLPYNRGGVGMGMMGGMAASGNAPTTIATLVYAGRADQVVPLPQKLIPVQPLSSPAQNRNFLLGPSMGGGMMGGGMSFAINGRTFDPGRIDTQVRLGDIEEWEFVNLMAMDHPMHIHTNSFQVVKPDGSVEAAWRDVVLVPAGDRVRVRTAFRDFTGTLVYHCHILDHEDLGMMGVLVIGGQA